MITVTLLRDARRHIRAFHAEGHAAYAPHGRDIVCAAVSALTQCALLGLNGYVRAAAYRVGDGLLCVTPRMNASKRREADAILETMRLGLYSIRMEHTKHLRIIEKEVDEHVFHELAAICPQKRRGQFAQRTR